MKTIPLEYLIISKLVLHKLLMEGNEDALRLYLHCLVIGDTEDLKTGEDPEPFGWETKRSDAALQELVHMDIVDDYSEPVRIVR